MTRAMRAPEKPTNNDTREPYISDERTSLPGVVGPERMGARRRRVDVADRNPHIGIGVVGRQQRGENGDDHGDPDHDQPDPAQAMAPQSPKDRHTSVTRGSSLRYKSSANRLVTMTAMARSRKAPWRTG